ncbi:MAG TPA: sigma-70 family RNA polymerase sigma factor [Terriglobia bacterium]
MKAKKAVDEQTLVRSGLEGDPDALDALFSRYARPLYQTALRVLGNPEDAEDALQDGLLSAVRNLTRFEGRSQFSTWLTRIVINAALMRLRSQRVRRTVSIEQEDPEQGDLTLGSRIPDARPGPEESYARKERFEILERGLETLPPALQSAVWLRDVEGLSTTEAARTLGLSEGTLKSQLHRARGRLSLLIRQGRGLHGEPAAA